MSIRTAAPVILSCAMFATAIGCTSQPTSPSRLGSPPAIGAESTSSATASQSNTVSTLRFGKRTPGTIFVTSQGLYYDTFVVKDPLPMEGRFQLLMPDGSTEFGPGDPGYLGGRWWEDLNGNGEQDPQDHYFLCPLLPPGRETA